MKNEDIINKLKEMNGGLRAQNNPQFNSGFIEGAVWMKRQMINEIWNLIYKNIAEISEELSWETTTPTKVANKIKRMLEK
jgi:hypothetical protein